MDGSPISPVAATIAAIGKPASLVAIEAEIRQWDAVAEERMEEIRALDPQADSSSRDARLIAARRERLNALDLSSKCRVKAQPLLERHREALAKALQPIADRLAEAVAADLDELAERLLPAVRAYNAAAWAIFRAGGVRFPLPHPSLPDGFTKLLAQLERYSIARAKEAAERGKRRIFGRR
jgi:hypothetical protein